jgi:hypothetical protein
MQPTHANDVTALERRLDHPWLATLLESLDRRLQLRQGVREFTCSPDCVFRMQVAVSDFELTLSDGTCVRPGDRIINLHLWNEQIPSLPEQGPSMAWARQMKRAFDNSFRELALHLAERRDLDDVIAICGTMAFGTAAQTNQLARIAGRYGFERIPVRGKPSLGKRVHRFAENVFISLFVFTRNPATLRADTLSRDRTPVCLSRRTLQRRYGAAVA